MARAADRPVVPWPKAGAAVCVGFSGGLDSTVLLHLLRASALEEGAALTAVHVHHGLSPHADRWAEACRLACEQRGVPLEVVRVAVDRDSRLGIEAEARRARYGVFAARPEAFVALAHHRDDQAETLLLQLLRGTGVKGISAMPAMRSLGERVTLYRPLLPYARAALHAYARSEGLTWIEDESNESQAYDRNFLRHAVAPLLDARFPSWRGNVTRFAAQAGSAQRLLDELARLDGLPATPGEALPLVAQLDGDRRANLLRAFLAANGLAMPAEARLAQMARQLYEARGDARVRIEHDGVSITRHRGTARIERGCAAMPWRVDWGGQSDVSLGHGLGEVHFDASRGEGLCLERMGDGAWFFAPRAGGERIRLAPGRPRRTLKNLLQEHGVPAWERARVPLLFHGEALVWVPGVGIDAEYACKRGEPGLKPQWRVAGRSPLC